MSSRRSSRSTLRTPSDPLLAPSPRNTAHRFFLPRTRSPSGGRSSSSAASTRCTRRFLLNGRTRSSARLAGGPLAPFLLMAHGVTRTPAVNSSLPSRLSLPGSSSPEAHTSDSREWCLLLARQLSTIGSLVLHWGCFLGGSPPQVSSG